MAEEVSKQRLVISLVGEDGTIVETVYRPDLRTTALALARTSGIDVVPELRLGDAVYVPVRATNNLIKHNVLVLPSEPAEYDDVGRLLSEIESYIRRYVGLPNAATVLSASYILLSWVYDAFNELPYLRFRGDYGTGKTRALLVIGSLCHKGFFASGASTISPIFHTLDTFKGTLIFDEADFRFTDEKAELVKILNNGNVRGFPVLRTQVTTKKEFDPRAFAIFGPKIVGMRRSYDDRALESRFLTIEMEPGRSGGVPINLPESQKDEALFLRNKLLMYRLRNRLTVRLEPVLADPTLEPRMNQILLPLLSIIPDSGRRNAISGFAKTLQAAVMAERGTTTDAQVLTVLRAFSLDRASDAISLAEITTAFAEKYGTEYDRPIANRWIGSILRRLGIILYKSNGVITMLSGQTERIDALCERYGVGDTVGKLAA
ncbi:MAG: hypothetical protein KGJ66_07090 [Alphaproteobacteria bacterium]|nr:hypothetical protein [Alphaproteobacteria bacterium]